VAAVVFNEPQFQLVASRLAGAALYAPDLLDFEIANVCLKKIRRHPSERVRIIRLHDAYRKFAIQRMPIAFDAAIATAERHKISLYDASYLWLAQTLEIELVTLDRELENAARNP
jgi:predicted nucleic acid-binding protein